jgi:HNH endonuclease
MRPVDKGTSTKTYARYQDAIDDLEAKLGLYCSYCERRIPVGGEVEHKSPKSSGGALLEWENFLLACKSCNTAKGKKPASQATSLWPDSDNTMLALSYAPGGFVAVRAGLSTTVKPLAQKLVDLLNLSRHKHGPGRKPTRRDKRWEQRDQIWSLAEIKKAELINAKQSERAKDMNNIVQIAQGFGFFSVWMTVFDDIPEMKRLLIHAFKSTAADCFEPTNCSLVNRPKGRI